LHLIGYAAASHLQVRNSFGRTLSLPSIKEHDFLMTDKEIPHEYYGWWRIIETSQWDNDDIDIIGTALISLTLKIVNGVEQSEIPVTIVLN
jgi:hypothetical protein